MAKDNKITVMPKVKSDFDKFERKEDTPNSAIAEQCDPTLKPVVATNLKGEPQLVVVDATETVKGTATFNRGGTLPDIIARGDADPLHVESLILFRRLIAGGYITPWALPVLYDVDKMIAKLKDTVEVKT